MRRIVPILICLTSACGNADYRFDSETVTAIHVRGDGDINDICYTPGGTLDDGTPQTSNTKFYACYMPSTKEIWISKWVYFDDAVQHEFCHAFYGWERRECDKAFPVRKAPRYLFGQNHPGGKW